VEYSTHHLDYLARSFLDVPGGYISEPLPSDEIFRPAAESLCLLTVTELFRSWPEHFAEAKRAPEGSARQPRWYRSAEVLTGCNGTHTPIVFVVRARAGRISVSLGTCAPVLPPARLREATTAIEIVRRGFASHYPGIRFEQADLRALFGLGEEGEAPELVGLLTGIPTAKPSEEFEQPTQVDMLIRSMTGRDWGIMIVAQPLSLAHAQSLAHQTTNEMRQVDDAEQTRARPGPLAERYLEALGMLNGDFQQALATGLWSCSTYYFAADRSTFDCLAASLRSCFSGERSCPDPVRTLEWPNLLSLAPLAGVVLTQAERGPGDFRYPYRFQTLLSSPQLAAMLHLPRMEMPGFAVRDAARLDVAAPRLAANSLTLGTILDYGRETENAYGIAPDALNKHALVVGVTGSGKSNTCRHLLRQLWQKGIPFLVIEPAKKEYRRLIADERIGPDLTVLTLGRERDAPLRLNPLAFDAGVALATHIDLLKSVFNAAFAMWTVLPQILEQSLHEVYRCYGWDSVRSENARIGDATPIPAEAFPTLADLHRTIASVVDRLGYEPNTTSELKAALLTRIQSLRIGGKGRMLDTREDFPIGELLAKPTVLELEDIGDDDEKAFLMGLLLVRIYEHLRSVRSETEPGLRHVIVIEEAHRLLANVPQQVSTDVGNARGKAVESFVNMLSEVRAYGEGFLVAEQIPAKLAPDVIKNTNLKVVHRTIAGDDRALIGQAINLQQRHLDTLGALRCGEAVVFAEGDDRPLLIKVAKYSPPAPAGVADVEKSIRQRATRRFRHVTYDCVAGCRHFTEREPCFCDQAQGVSEQTDVRRAVAQYVLSVVVCADAVTVGLDGLREQVRWHCFAGRSVEQWWDAVLIHSISLHLRELGHAYQWPFRDTEKLREVLIPVLLQASRSGSDKGARLESFRSDYRRLCARNFEPFRQCRLICDTEPAVCLYRFHTASLLNESWLKEDFLAAAQAADGVVDSMADVCQQAALQCLSSDVSRGEIDRVALCYAQQNVLALTTIAPTLRAKLLSQLIGKIRAAAR
jgi:DNA helicase HerA-like ATPase